MGWGFRKNPWGWLFSVLFAWGHLKAGGDTAAEGQNHLEASLPLPSPPPWAGCLQSLSTGAPVHGLPVRLGLPHSMAASGESDFLRAGPLLGLSWPAWEAARVAGPPRLKGRDMTVPMERHPRTWGPRVETSTPANVCTHTVQPVLCSQAWTHRGKSRNHVPRMGSGRQCGGPSNSFRSTTSPGGGLPTPGTRQTRFRVSQTTIPRSLPPGGNAECRSHNRWCCEQMSGGCMIKYYEQMICYLLRAGDG